MGLSLTPSTDMRSQIRQGLLSRGLAPHIADAFIMNFQDESGLNPGINEIAPLVPGSRGGFGLYQLTGPRRVAYEQFAKQRGVNPADVDAQLDFMMMELQGPESRAAKSIFSAPDTGSAAAAIVTNFLRPAEEHRNRRVAKYTGGMSQPNSGTAPPMQGILSTSSPQTEAPMEEQKATGLLGSLFPNMTADRQDRLAVALSGLSMFPNQGVMQMAGQRMGERREDRKEAKTQAAERQRANTTIETLRQAGVPEQDLQIAAGNPEYMRALLGQVLQARWAKPEAKYRQVTGATAAAMGLDPNKVYNLGSDGKVSGIGGGDTVITNNMGPTGVDYGDPGNGLVWQRDQSGNVVTDERGAPIAIPYQGGPVWNEQAQAAAAESDRQQVATNQQGVRDTVIGRDVDRLVAMIDRGGLFNLPEAGIWGGLLAKMGINQEAVDFGNTVQGIQAAVAFDTLKQMRDASKTGGALGAVSERELDLLISAYGSLQQTTSPQILRENLLTIKNIMTKITNDPVASRYYYGGSTSSGGGPTQSGGFSVTGVID